MFKKEVRVTVAIWISGGYPPRHPPEVDEFCAQHSLSNDFSVGQRILAIAFIPLSLSLSLSQTNMWTKMCLIWPEAQINNMKTHNNNIFFVFYNVQINPFRNSKPIQHFYFVKVQTIIFQQKILLQYVMSY